MSRGIGRKALYLATVRIMITTCTVPTFVAPFVIHLYTAFTSDPVRDLNTDRALLDSQRELNFDGLVEAIEFAPLPKAPVVATTKQRG